MRTWRNACPATSAEGPVLTLSAIADDVRAAAARFAAAGIGSPEHDAEALAAHVLGVDRRRLLGLGSWPPGAAERYRVLVDRRCGREPLQHLTGVAYFRYLELAVGQGVFIPRPETELLVDLVLPVIPAGGTVVDLCAGSGAVGLAIATERPDTAVHLVELDPGAADWLRRNVTELSPRASTHCCSVLDAVSSVGPWRAHVVIANPPYLLAGSEVEPEVERDPALALWGGPDGLDTIREVAVAARALLVPGGTLAIEHDAAHQGAVVDLFEQHGFHDVAGHQDLTGRPRFVTARTGRRSD